MHTLLAHIETPHCTKILGRALKQTVFLIFLCAPLLLLQGYTVKANTTNNEATQVPYIINNTMYYPLSNSAGFRQKGIASWYGDSFHGRNTSNGERYDMYDMTAAHKTLPMNTMLLVKNLENGRETIVRINDRGPFVRGRIIDLSYRAAQKLGMINKGVSKVQLIALADKQTLIASARGKAQLPNLRQGEYYVQIGSFGRKMNALNLQKRFTDAGHTTVIQKHYGPDTTFYRVQVYAGRELTVARRAEQALLDHGYSGAFVVAR